MPPSSLPLHHITFPYLHHETRLPNKIPTKVGLEEQRKPEKEMVIPGPDFEFLDNPDLNHDGR